MRGLAEAGWPNSLPTHYYFKLTINLAKKFPYDDCNNANKTSSIVQICRDFLVISFIPYQFLEKFTKSIGIKLKWAIHVNT